MLFTEKEDIPSLKLTAKAPENDGLEHDFPFQLVDFWVLAVNFQGWTLLINSYDVSAKNHGRFPGIAIEKEHPVKQPLRR